MSPRQLQLARRMGIVVGLNVTRRVVSPRFGGDDPSWTHRYRLAFIGMDWRWCAVHHGWTGRYAGE